MCATARQTNEVDLHFSPDSLWTWTLDHFLVNFEDGQSWRRADVILTFITLTVRWLLLTTHDWQWPRIVFSFSWSHSEFSLFFFEFILILCFSSDKRPEQSIAAARASVMVYDDLNKKWVPAGSSHGLSKVIIFILDLPHHHHQYHHPHRHPQHHLQRHHPKHHPQYCVAGAHLSPFHQQHIVCFKSFCFLTTTSLAHSVIFFLHHLHSSSSSTSSSLLCRRCTSTTTSSTTHSEWLDANSKTTRWGNRRHLIMI